MDLIVDIFRQANTPVRCSVEVGRWTAESLLCHGDLDSATTRQEQEVPLKHVFEAGEAVGWA